MVDFSSLVLAPAMANFGKPFTVSPLVSQKLASPYPAIGVWTVTQTDIITEDGGTLSTSALKLGIRLADFLVVPKQGDWISTDVSSLPLGYWQGDVDPALRLDFIIHDTNPDGQGGMVLILKRVTS